MAGEKTVISTGIRLTGDLAGDGDVLILGRVDGQLHVGGELVVAPGGLARADVVAARVRIDGHLEGRVRATQQVVIGSHGTLIGDVQGLLAVEEGGTFKGRVDVEIDTTTATTADPLRSVRRLPLEATTPVQGTFPTPRRFASDAGASQPVLTLRQESTLRRWGSDSSLAEEDRPTGPIARPILSVPVRERTPTHASSERPTGAVGEDRRSARRPKRLLTRRDTPQESEPTHEMDSVSMRAPAPLPPPTGYRPPTGYPPQQSAHPAPTGYPPQPSAPTPETPRAPQTESPTRPVQPPHTGREAPGAATSRRDPPPVVRAGGHRPGTGPSRTAPPRPLLPVVHPPHVHRPAVPTPRRPKKGDQVKDRADLTDEWFLDDDEELRRR